MSHGGVAMRFGHMHGAGQHSVHGGGAYHFDKVPNGDMHSSYGKVLGLKAVRK